MTLIFEYGERKEQKGRNEGERNIILGLIGSGFSVDEIPSMIGKSSYEVNKILSD